MSAIKPESDQETEARFKQYQQMRKCLIQEFNTVSGYEGKTPEGSTQLATCRATIISAIAQVDKEMDEIRKRYSFPRESRPFGTNLKKS